MSMFKNDVGGTRPPAQSSAPQKTAVGSGSRPTSSKMGIQTSAAADPRTLGRAPSGWLK